MHRTQITLTDSQYARLRGESAKSGRSLAELVRRALDELYDPVSKADRPRLLGSAFGAWRDRDESGAEFVERVRSGTARRLRSTGTTRGSRTASSRRAMMRCASSRLSGGGTSEGSRGASTSANDDPRSGQRTRRVQIDPHTTLGERKEVVLALKLRFSLAPRPQRLYIGAASPLLLVPDLLRIDIFHWHGHCPLKDNA
jgi:Ribbon-helix-helix protein, copG family